MDQIYDKNSVFYVPEEQVSLFNRVLNVFDVKRKLSTFLNPDESFDLT